MAEELQLASSDFQCSNNNLKHHTAAISTERLFVRRGEDFAVSLHFKPRGFFPETDQIVFIAETGPWPEESARTKVVIPLASSRAPKSWGAVVASSGPNSLLVSMFTPGNAVIGQYALKLYVSTRKRYTTYLLGQFVLLFNSWCPEDAVYLSDDGQRKEYVLNEYGFIYQGNHNWIRPSPWIFGQFEEDLVDICLKIMDKNLNFQQDAFKDMARRYDPVYVSRIVCAMINCNDDAGVLQGNWSGNYDKGTSPSTWNGSVSILREWYTKECQPVQYGQCWVFAAVMCTVMRCLGIPSRVVTNFDSAHDTNANLFVEEVFDSTGKKLNSSSHDSIWNFHVWTECWMERRDLSPGYGGWQVLDPTPQEKSDGIYCCGPASVKAIKEGDIDLCYDAPFVFAMANADCISWIVSGWKKEKYFRDTRSVGTHISTKCVGSDDRDDITNNYKYLEGSPKEREVFEKAIVRLRQPRRSTRENGLQPFSIRSNTSNESVSSAPTSEEIQNQDEPCPNRPLSDAQISLKLKLTTSPQIGEDIGLILIATNLDFNSKKLKLNLSGQSMQHNGKPLLQFWKDSIYIDLGPSEEKKILFKIPYSMYGKSLDENNIIQMIAVGEENQYWKKLLVVKDITLAVPDVIINVLGEAVMRKKMTIELIYANPLSEPVENCELVIEGTGLIKRGLQIRVKPMKPRETARLHIEMYPFKPGLKQLQVNFSCNKFKVCKGYKKILVV